MCKSRLSNLFVRHARNRLEKVLAFKVASPSDNAILSSSTTQPLVVFVHVQIYDFRLIIVPAQLQGQLRTTGMIAQDDGMRSNLHSVGEVHTNLSLVGSCGKITVRRASRQVHCGVLNLLFLYTRRIRGGGVAVVGRVGGKGKITLLNHGKVGPVKGKYFTGRSLDDETFFHSTRLLSGGGWRCSAEQWKVTF
jgi:hypothetical protein